MSNRTKVFIAGSRRLSRLNKDMRRRIDNIVNKGFTVIVGDANGVDRAVQRYLSSRHYGSVVSRRFAVPGVSRWAKVMKSSGYGRSWNR